MDKKKCAEYLRLMADALESDENIRDVEWKTDSKAISIRHFKSTDEGYGKKRTSELMMTQTITYVVGYD